MQNQPVIDANTLNTMNQKRSNPLLDKIHNLSDKLSGGSKVSSKIQSGSVPQPAYQAGKQTGQNHLTHEMQLLLQQKHQIDQEMQNTFTEQQKIQHQPQQPRGATYEIYNQQTHSGVPPVNLPTNQRISEQADVPMQNVPSRQTYQDQNYQNLIQQLKTRINNLETENKALKEQLLKQEQESAAMKENFDRQLAELEAQIMGLGDVTTHQESPGRRIIQAYAEENVLTGQAGKVLLKAVPPQSTYQPPSQQPVISTHEQPEQPQQTENNILTQSAGSLALELAAQQAAGGLSEFDQKWQELEAIEARQEQLRQQRVQLADEQRQDAPQRRAVQQRSSIFSQNVIQREMQQEKQADLIAKIQGKGTKVVYKHQCTKILLPEGTGLKEQAAKRVVVLEKTNEGPILAWYRQNGNELQISGIMQLAQIVNVAAAEQAQLFRSKVLMARKAGYVNDIFDLIGQGIIDQLEPASLVRAACSVIFFTDQAVLCFDFGSDKEEFEAFCKALLDLGV